ncbi:MAG: gliding motility-associated C-terminal domain-containing protein [Flavobacteriales bacterium]|nr:gliding motility-associated C-terminal domain-containing protein [Flavobacteriales bacterium]
MKHYLLRTLLFLLSIVNYQLTIGQTFLNGDFENNTAGGFDQINLTNDTYNSMMADCFAFGSYGDMDIMNSATYCGLAQNGSWFVALTGGITDAITLTLTSTLISGQSYTFSFWDRACVSPGFSTSAPPIQIGVSTINNDIGTILYTVGTPVEATWTQRTLTFTAPFDALYISVSMATGGTSDWTQIDNFSFDTVSCPLVLDLGDDAILCEGESLTLDATLPDGTYLWSDNSTNNTLDATADGNYSVEVTVDACVYSDDVFVDFITPPVVDIGADTSICSGENILLDATTPGATYLWQDGATSATYTASVDVNYSCTVSFGSCSSSDSMVLAVDATPVANLGADVGACEGEDVLLDATTAGATYLWSDDSTQPTLSVSTAGNYSIEITLGNCADSDDVDVDFTPYPVIDLGPDSTICFDETLQLNATTAGATYLWQDGSTLPGFIATEEGDYSVDVDVNGCITNDEVSVTVIDSVANPISLSLSEYCLEEGDSLMITDLGENDSLVWNTGAQGKEIPVFIAGVYSCELELTCQTHTSEILVQACQVLIPTIIDVYVPNAFTPNHDGINELFRPSIFTTWPVEDYSFMVYDRWGEVIFHTEEPGKGWMGDVHDGEHFVRDGVYVWEIKITSNTVAKKLNGHVLIIR